MQCNYGSIIGQYGKKAQIIVKKFYENNMVHFIGAGSGAADLITVRGARLLKEADVVIYAGSLVNILFIRKFQKFCHK